jgi:hypothetical protein
MGKSEHTFSTNDEICTPRAILDPLEAALGPIGLDPFGHPTSLVGALTTIMLPHYRAHVAPKTGGEIIWGDAYDHDWSGRGLVFCNGPYSDCARWAHQMWSERGGDEVVGLLPVRTGSVWWQTWTAHSDAILFLKGRVHFDNYPHQAPFHSALSYVGSRGDHFVEHMKHLGWCVRNRRSWT